MRNRATLIIVLFVILLVIILAQNGSLGQLFSGILNTTPIFNAPTARPFATAAPIQFNTAQPGNGVFPTPNLPPAYAPTYPGQTNGQSANSPTAQPGSAPSAGILQPNGQCIAPNGWIAYTIQAGETLATIAQNYNLTTEQLAAANCLTNPDLIYEGQVVAVP
ncbi:MAG: LysM peptidoglycan-binding domain-containing protein [Chloroflexota bacterium]